jgi:hypothetical protein
MLGKHPPVRFWPVSGGHVTKSPDNACCMKTMRVMGAASVV